MLRRSPNNIRPERQDTNPNLPKLNMKVETIHLNFLLLNFFPFPSDAGDFAFSGKEVP